MVRLRSLLLRWLLIPTLLLWAAGFAFDYLHSLSQAHEAYDRTLLGSALVVAETLRLADGEIVAELPLGALEMLRTDAQDRVFYRVSDREAGGDGHGGRYVTGYADLPAPPADPGAGPLFYDADYNGQRVRIVALRHTLLGHDERRALQVQVAETLDARHQVTHRLVLQSALAQLALIGLAAGLIAWGVRRGLAPLRRLRDQVRKRDVDDLTPVDTEAVPREVAPLIDAINAHTERQRQLSDAQLRFVANASHQLKTPLTVLRAQVGQAMQQTDLGAMRAIVSRLDEATEATSRLVGQLLALSRSEPGHVLDTSELDLAKLAQQATFELVGAAIAKEIDLGFEAGEPVFVRADRVLMGELVTNLAHNAVSYTPEHGRVTVSVGRRGGRAWLRVVDDGPGIPPDERARVFERFHRLAGTAAPGSGLGLAIVHEICARYRISIELADPPDGGHGLCVDLLWPPPAATPGA